MHEGTEGRAGGNEMAVYGFAWNIPSWRFRSLCELILFKSVDATFSESGRFAS